MLVKLLLAVSVFILSVATGSFANAAEAVRYVTIGTGAVTGVYYPAGIAIAKLVNGKRKQHNLRATVESTDGSVFNVNALLLGDLEFGLVQSDRQYQAYSGTADWQGNPQAGLRSVFSMHPETVTIVAAQDAQIQELADLKGKIVNVGNVGSGQRGNALHLLAAAGIDPATELTAQSWGAADSAGKLQDGHLDALIYTAGHPNGTLKEAVSGRRKVSFIAIPAEIIRDLTGRFAYYTAAEIPVNRYPGVMNTANLDSFGVRATLCTSAAIDDEIVYAFTKEVFDNFEEFKQLHPAFSDLTRQGMLQGLTAPIHPGAMRYYRQTGLK